MQAYECTAEIDAAGALHLPLNVQHYVRSHDKVRVLLLLDDSPVTTTEQQVWNSLTANEFLRGYAEDDAIYDAL